MFNPADDQVLDTLKFKGPGIFLKDLHIERSFEACRILNPAMKKSELRRVYQNLENHYLGKVSDSQILRILFSIEQTTLNFDAQIVERIMLPKVLSLQLISEPRQQSGLGSQNYKWGRRDFWDQVWNQKNPQADDVIAVNTEGDLTETSRCNLFCYDSVRDVVLTPKLNSGCINGVYRRYVMENESIALPPKKPGSSSLAKKVIEEDIDPKKIATYEIYVANSVREVLAAKLFISK